MPHIVRVKDGVQFTVIAAGGFRILSAIDQVADKFGIDLTITSACDGEHSGPGDPHHRGEAYDVRTHDFPPDVSKQTIVTAIMILLGFECFYGFLEDAGTENEHAHFQVRKGSVYP